MHHFLYYHMDQMQEYYHFTLRYALLIVHHPIHQLSEHTWLVYLQSKG